MKTNTQTKIQTSTSTTKIETPYSPNDPELKEIQKKSPAKAELLKAAAKGCNINILSLLDNGVDIHTSDHNGPDAPLRYACANGHPSTVMLLLKKDTLLTNYSLFDK